MLIQRNVKSQSVINMAAFGTHTYEHVGSEPQITPGVSFFVIYEVDIRNIGDQLLSPAILTAKKASKAVKYKTKKQANTEITKKTKTERKEIQSHSSVEGSKNDEKTGLFRGKMDSIQPSTLNTGSQGAAPKIGGSRSKDELSTLSPKSRSKSKNRRSRSASISVPTVSISSNSSSNSKNQGKKGRKRSYSRADNFMSSFQSKKKDKDKDKPIHSRSRSLSTSVRKRVNGTQPMSLMLPKKSKDGDVVFAVHTVTEEPLSEVGNLFKGYYRDVKDDKGLSSTYV